MVHFHLARIQDLTLQNTRMSLLCRRRQAYSNQEETEKNQSEQREERATHPIWPAQTVLFRVNVLLSKKMPSAWVNEQVCWSIIWNRTKRKLSPLIMRWTAATQLSTQLTETSVPASSSVNIGELYFFTDLKSVKKSSPIFRGEEFVSSSVHHLVVVFCLLCPNNASAT